MEFNLMITDYGISKSQKENNLKFGFNKNITRTIDF